MAPDGAVAPPATRNAKRRAKRKLQRAEGAQEPVPLAPRLEPARVNGADAADRAGAGEVDTNDVATLAVQAPDLDSEMARQFAGVLARYAPPEEAEAPQAPQKGDVFYSDDDMESESEHEEETQPRMSKRKQRRMQRMSVAELKQLVRRPEVVEWYDVAATDPQLLIHLKSYRNAVPVPVHWSYKREYLHHRRGVEKPHYQLPSYIAETGIATMRDAIAEADQDKTLKAKTRERVQPKLGRMDIDYQKLHDAFFRFQTRPPLTGYGETYYEGKEVESKFKARRPTALSPALKEALSIPPLAPPPWLIAMQRYGPPPSYPHLKIPGLNAPIPEGAQWGFHPGGWGRPPLDERGNPLYGDVFGERKDESQSAMDSEPVEREHWGELEPDVPDEEDEESEEEDESEEEEQDEEEEPAEEEAEEPAPTVEGGIETPAAGLETPSGMQSLSGIQSVPEGLETPDHIELRKNAGRDAQEGEQEPPRPLYHVIPERAAGSAGRGFLGSERLYDLPPREK